jgi:hypothetical protein
MGKTITSMRGREVDLERLNMVHETTPAVGNAKVNARGDELGPGGVIKRTREQVLADYYAHNPNAVREDAAARKK